MDILEKPTDKLLDKYIFKFQNDKRYEPADKAIINLFSAFPKNKKLEDILLKISVINDLYSTNILGTFRMAEHIQNLNIDDQLKEGNPEVVNKIAKGHGIRTKKNNKELYFYSFATKYCNWHNQKSYAIYDSFVEKVLMAYKRQDKFLKFTNDDLRDFVKFKKIIKGFAEHYELKRHNLKEIDKFLWIYGKEKFPTNYEKKNKNAPQQRTEVKTKHFLH